MVDAPKPVVKVRFEDFVAAVVKAKSPWDLESDFLVLQQGMQDLLNRVTHIEKHQASGQASSSSAAGTTSGNTDPRLTDADVAAIKSMEQTFKKH